MENKDSHDTTTQDIDNVDKLHNAVNVKIGKHNGCLYHYGHFISDFFIGLVRGGVRFDSCLRLNIREHKTETEDVHKLGQHNKLLLKVLFPHVTFSFPTDFDPSIPSKEYSNPVWGTHACSLSKAEVQESQTRVAKLFHDYAEEFCSFYKLHDVKSPGIVLIKRSNVNLGTDLRVQSNGSQRRRILNIDDVYKALIEKFCTENVAMVEFEHLPLLDQLKYIHNCHTCIGVQGSGFYNCYFMKPGGKIITNAQVCYVEHMCTLRQLQFKQLTNLHPDLTTPYPSWEIDIDELILEVMKPSRT